MPEGQALGAPETDCCMKWIKFGGVRSGVRIYAFDDGGNPANHNGPRLRTSRTTKLSCDARTVSIVVEEDGAPAASFTLDCESFRKRIFTEPMPPTTGARSLARPRELFEIVDFKTGSYESPAASIPEGLRGGIIPHDGEAWPSPTPHKRSGALVRLSVPLSSLSDYGCREACWSQTVSTVNDKWNPATGRWKTLSRSKPHNDNLDADPKPGGKPWYCYGAETTEDGTDGKELVLDDGHHMVHGDTYWSGGKKVTLERGDVIPRRSAFVSQQICYDPAPAKSLVSLLWSVTTLYTHNTEDLSEGGEMVTTGPVVVTVEDVPGKKDRRALEKYLRKRRGTSRRARCDRLAEGLCEAAKAAGPASQSNPDRALPVRSYQAAIQTGSGDGGRVLGCPVRSFQ